MWKDLYCYALRIDMVLPDWRGLIGLGLDCFAQVLVPIDLKLALQPHILKGTCTEPRLIDFIGIALMVDRLRISSGVDNLCMVAVC